MQSLKLNNLPIPSIEAPLYLPVQGFMYGNKCMSLKVNKKADFRVWVPTVFCKNQEAMHNDNVNDYIAAIIVTSDKMVYQPTCTH